MKIFINQRCDLCDAAVAAAILRLVYEDATVEVAPLEALPMAEFDEGQNAFIGFKPGDIHQQSTGEIVLPDVLQTGLAQQAWNKVGALYLRSLGYSEARMTAIFETAEEGMFSRVREPGFGAVSFREVFAGALLARGPLGEGLKLAELMVAAALRMAVHESGSYVRRKALHAMGSKHFDPTISDQDTGHTPNA